MTTIDLHTHNDGSQSRPVLVMGHTLATDHTMWGPQVAAFSKDYRLVRLDFRGHGRSPAPEGAYTLDELADDVIALMDRLGVRRAHYLGISMGGMIGQVLGIRYPGRFDKLVLASTSSELPPQGRAAFDERIKTVRDGGMEPQVEPTLGRWFTDEYRQRTPEVVERIASLIRRTPPAGFIGWCEAIKHLDLTGRLGGIKNPTLVLSGAADPGAPPAAGEMIAKAIPGADFHIIPEVKHQLSIEAAGTFNRLVLEFLARE